MAFNVVPTSFKEFREKATHLDAFDEACRVFSYCVKHVPDVKDPIAMDKGNSKDIKLFRGLQGFVEIDEIRSACKVDKLKLNKQSWGNGSRKGGGANNAGTAFEKKLQAELATWVADNKYPSGIYGDLVKQIVEDHGLEDCRAIDIVWAGPQNTARPLKWSGGWMVGSAGKGNFDIGSKVTDVTIKLTCKDGSKRNVYISAKTTGTVALSNLGTKKNVFPPKDILKEKPRSGSRFPDAGKYLCKTFGIDEEKMCAVFKDANDQHKQGITNVKVKVGEVDTSPKYDRGHLSDLIKGCLGHGYHYAHLQKSYIKNFNVTDKVNDATSKVSKVEIYYGGKSGEGQRIDMLVETNTMELKFNIRDTSGKGEGIPDKFQAGYKFYDESEWTLGDGEYDDG